MNSLSEKDSLYDIKYFISSTNIRGPKNIPINYFIIIIDGGESLYTDILNSEFPYDERIEDVYLLNRLITNGKKIITVKIWTTSKKLSDVISETPIRLNSNGIEILEKLIRKFKTIEKRLNGYELQMDPKIMVDSNGIHFFFVEK